MAFCQFGEHLLGDALGQRLHRCEIVADLFLYFPQRRHKCVLYHRQVCLIYRDFLSVDSSGRLHSGIRFELYQGLYYEIEDWVREGVVDFGFTDMLRTIPFPCEPIYQDTMLAVLPEGHPLGENIFIQVDELAAEPFILLEEGRGGGCIRDLLTRHPQINVQYRVADDYTILNLVENNLGVSILPEAVLRRSGRRVIARRLSPELQRTVGVVYKQKTGLSTAGQMFLSELKASIPNVRG